MRKKRWAMPKELEPYRELICNTGGNTIEDLMNRDPREANVVINAPLALLCVAVSSQITLLLQLRRAGKLP